MKSTPSGDRPPAVIDAKPYVQHHPTIGYFCKPSIRQTLPRPGGGQYELATNSIGIRSEREYAIAKPAGVFRIVILGDSFAAGQYVSNDQRFSELLERRLPNVEVMNFALEGTGTDQQLLIFETMARQYEPDLIILMPFLQNIRRNLADARLSYDPQTLSPVMVPKPRFDLLPDGSLELKNVPVSTERKPAADPAAAGVKTDATLSLKTRIKSALNNLPFMATAKKLIYRVIPWEPFPEYKSPADPAWKLMEAIIRRLHHSAGGKPVVIAPTFYVSYVIYPMARNYWDRFSSLTAIPGVHAVDLLPYFKRLGGAATGCFQEPYDVHFSSQGNLVVADALEQELKSRQLLP